MNIKEIMSYEPQLVDAISGPEPSLHHVLEMYYLQHDIKPSDARKYVAQYIAALEKEFK